MKTVVLYIHGKGGNAEEINQYTDIFADCDYKGLDYKTFTPWETGKEIKEEVTKLKENYDNIILIANSIGAFFSLNADISNDISEAFFISPVVDMERLIRNMMEWAGITEEELKEKGIIETQFGETLDYDYLSYVRNNPIKWNVKTHIIYGDNDNLVSPETIKDFSDKHNATLDIMKNGEHWFHTEEQIKFVTDTIRKYC